MRIGIVQFAPRFDASEPNWNRMEQWAKSVPADVLVFPELASCGYMYTSREEAEPYSNARTRIRQIAELAKSEGRLIVGGFSERADSVLYDSAFAAGPRGITVYRKIHLWNKETVIFRAGSDPAVLEYDGHRFGLEICYDLQFPEQAAYLARNGAEALLVPTAWAEEPQGPLHGLHPYNHLAIGSAFAHGIFVAVANRVGIERGARFPGQSSLTNPFGQLECLDEREGVLIREIDFGLLEPAKRPNEYNDLDRDPRFGIAPPSGETVVARSRRTRPAEAATGGRSGSGIRTRKSSRGERRRR
jgi:N-carbamoylputrescine amidase